MAKADTGLTAAQLAIMSLFWEQGELGVAQVWQLLGQRRRLARNTVQTTLTRLAEKGWLHVRRDGNTDYFRAGAAAQRGRTRHRRATGRQRIRRVDGGADRDAARESADLVRRGRAHSELIAAAEKGSRAR